MEEFNKTEKRINSGNLRDVDLSNLAGTEEGRQQIEELMQYFADQIGASIEKPKAILMHVRNSMKGVTEKEFIDMVHNCKEQNLGSLPQYPKLSPTFIQDYWRRYKTKKSHVKVRLGMHVDYQVTGLSDREMEVFTIWRWANELLNHMATYKETSQYNQWKTLIGFKRAQTVGFINVSNKEIQETFEEQRVKFIKDNYERLSQINKESSFGKQFEEVQDEMWLSLKPEDKLKNDYYREIAQMTRDIIVDKVLKELNYDSVKLYASIIERLNKISKEHIDLSIHDLKEKAGV